MNVVFDILRIGMAVAVIALAIRAWRMSREVRQDMAELRCPHCHERIFPKLP